MYLFVAIIVCLCRGNNSSAPRQRCRALGRSLPSPVPEKRRRRVQLPAFGEAVTRSNEPEPVIEKSATSISMHEIHGILH